MRAVATLLIDATRLDPARRFCNRKRKSILFSLVSSLVLSLSVSSNYCSSPLRFFFFLHRLIVSLCLLHIPCIFSFPFSLFLSTLCLFSNLFLLKKKNFFYPPFYIRCSLPMHRYRCISASFTLASKIKKKQKIPASLKTCFVPTEN